MEFVKAVPATAAARLEGDSIHLWRVPYAFPQGRAPLLTLLAAYLGIPAPSVVLDETARGKPHLARDVTVHGDPHHLEFNWSHSGDYALIAIARDHGVGVDIERLGKNLRSLEIARRFFDPAEAESLAALDGCAREHAFTSLWCAKEAVLKAAGEGLSFGLARLAFTRRRDVDWALSRVDPALGHMPDWRLAAFDAAPGYHGALAWRGGNLDIVALQPDFP